MFDVKTPKRIYYLAAESEEDMNKWVEYVCHVCGLKAYKDDMEGKVLLVTLILSLTKIYVSTPNWEQMTNGLDDSGVIS